MKKRFLVLMGVCCVVSGVFAQDTVTLGVFGYTKMDKPAGELNLIGVNYGDANQTLSDVCPVDQYTGSGLVSDADRIIVWDSSSQTYTTYALFDDGSGTKEWRLYNNFYGSAQNPAIPVGSGFWVDSKGSSTDTNIVVSGSVVLDNSVTNQIIQGLQLMGYSLSTERDLNDMALKAQGTGSGLVSGADRVIVWNVATQAYETYALFDDGSGTKEWRDYSNFYSSPGAIPVDLGHGFWYDAKSGFNWIEQNPYTASL